MVILYLALKLKLTSNKKARKAFIEDCEQLIDAQVLNKSGISGFAIKNAYKMVRKFSPKFVSSALDALMDDFMEQIKPTIDDYASKKSVLKLPIADFIGQRANEVADALLKVTDERAKRAEIAAIEKAYRFLRPRAQAHVAKAVPGLGQIIENHL